MKNTPNLFRYTTSELSQDAFICWLIEWAHPKYKEADYKLHKAGTELVKKIYSLHNFPFPAVIEKLDITRQPGGLDILVEINRKHAVLIEDKTYTSEHSDRLIRYRTFVRKMGYPFKSQLPIYFKTGNQGNYTAVTTAGYILFTRKDMLEILGKGMDMGIQNDIFQDYYLRLKEIDDRYKQYQFLPLQDWEGEM
jgi:hypothetical protein